MEIRERQLQKNLQLTMGSLALTEVRFPMAQGSRHQARR